eukprot:CAMPEP_0175047972 /NCGR_PEP_ID=MMETSP0052_2-20121109/5908_1 /TAXON_ID=51329 ORGANISM="Polytomella parva, Strain SAG 63-3" /NCGR_SAMPLE_ID=MMETSP0052_2 /ASSEMBLY_ACC=CAM_ASM_000194 /LENGTH=238 /DNA_ID=CAMNT_0016311939 /DNA_START=80 /DNA_END=796 /DNA_ORIENTATION=+
MNPLQKGAIAILSGLGALLRPQRGDLVATMGETTGEFLLPYLKSRMSNNPEGRLILMEKPRVTDEILRKAAAMPAGTFGAAYAEFMSSRGFLPADRPPVRFVDDPDSAYVMTRIREVHDFWHVLFNCHTNVFGEIALKAVEFRQTGLPMTGLAALGAQYKLKPEDRKIMQDVFMPWAARAGGACRDLVGIYYEKHLDRELDDVRREWKIHPAPEAPVQLKRHQNANKERLGGGGKKGT